MKSGLCSSPDYLTLPSPDPILEWYDGMLDQL